MQVSVTSEETLSQTPWWWSENPIPTIPGLAIHDVASQLHAHTCWTSSPRPWSRTGHFSRILEELWIARTNSSYIPKGDKRWDHPGTYNSCVGTRGRRPLQKEECLSCHQHTQCSWERSWSGAAHCISKALPENATKFHGALVHKSFPGMCNA